MPETVTSATAALAAFCMPDTFITHSGWGRHSACTAGQAAAMVWWLQLKWAYATITTISATMAVAPLYSFSAALCNLHTACHCQHHDFATSLYSYMYAGSYQGVEHDQKAIKNGTADSPVLVLAVWSTRLGLDSSAAEQRAYDAEGVFISLYCFRTSRKS